MTTPSYPPRARLRAPEPGTGPLPGTVPMAPDQQRLWAALSHLSPLALGPVGPLVLFLALKDRGSFVRHHSAQALNLQVVLTLVALVAAVTGMLALVTVGLAALVLAPVAAVIALAVLALQVVAAVRAHQGLEGRYPLALQLVR